MKALESSSFQTDADFRAIDLSAYELTLIICRLSVGKLNVYLISIKELKESINCALSTPSAVMPNKSLCLLP